MSDRIRLVVDGREVTAREGERVLWVALDHGIYIPHLCGLREQEPPAASCRLCWVEVEGLPEPVTACTLRVAPGMVVRTRSPRVDRLVSWALELLLSHHRLDCRRCPGRERCELRRIARERKLRLRATRLPNLDPGGVPDESPAEFGFDPGRCVLCGRCVWVCHEKVGVGAIGFVRRGTARRVSTFAEAPLAQSSCIQCLECVEVCPVGALYLKQREGGAS